MDELCIVTTGGTIDKIYFDDKSDFQVGEPQIGRILQELGVAFRFTVIPILRKDSLHLTHNDRELVRSTIAAQPARHVLVTHGTDSMVETAKVLASVADKTIVLNINLVGRPTSVQALENGNLLVALQHQNRVVEIDTGDKVVWQLDNVMGAIGAQRLPSGHTLVVESTGNRVREFDADKKEAAVIAQIEGQQLAMPYHAQRLETGNTLITDRAGVREVDSAGKVVWKRAEQWISRATRY